MQSDLISRSKLHKSIQREDPIIIDGLAYVRYDAMLAKISMATTIDASEVVRCRECALRGSSSCPMKYSGTGAYIGMGMYDEGRDNTNDNGFCHKGRRVEF